MRECIMWPNRWPNRHDDHLMPANKANSRAFASIPVSFVLNGLGEQASKQTDESRLARVRRSQPKLSIIDTLASILAGQYPGPDKHWIVMDAQSGRLMERAKRKNALDR